MTTDLWTSVDQYLEEELLPADPVLAEVLRSSAAAKLPDIQVSPNQGMLLHLLAKAVGARRVLEIGTLGGYSTIWLARALPADGQLVTLEFDPKHAEVARANVARAGLRDRVEIRVGAALETLPKLVAENRGPFDLFFLDADKANTRAYFEWSLKLSRPGSLIIVDNVVRKGRLVDSSSREPDVRGMRDFLDALASERRVRATGIQTVGKKGYDGFVLARVMDAPSGKVA